MHVPDGIGGGTVPGSEQGEWGEEGQLVPQHRALVATQAHLQRGLSQSSNEVVYGGGQLQVGERAAVDDVRGCGTGGRDLDGAADDPASVVAPAQLREVVDAIEQGHHHTATERLRRHPVKGRDQTRLLHGDEDGVDLFAQSGLGLDPRREVAESGAVTRSPSWASTAAVSSRARQMTRCPPSAAASPWHPNGA